ncbi:MAG: alpha/beta hydrolase, partial [Candidatus Nanopelagicales bacterium]
MTDQTTDITVLQDGFDPLGPTVRQAQVSSGRTVNYIDDGAEGEHTLLFFGGAGTTVRAFRLLEFARSLRRQLQIRVVSVERNGLGQTPFDPAVGFGEHASDVWSLLDQLEIERVSVVAISGGGPYAAHLAAANGDRIRSMHLACAGSENLDVARIGLSATAIASDPTAWWRFPDTSSVYRVPGFADSVIEEATRGVFARGRDTPPEGLAQAFELYRDVGMPDLRTVRSPSFLYWGSEDQLVPLAHMHRWQQALPNVTCTRLYDGEGHDVQYRHWDQILADVAFLGERIVVCNDGRAVLAVPDRAQA